MQYVALPAASRTACAIAEVLRKDGVVSLHTRCGAGVAVCHRAVDHIKAVLSLIQPKLVVRHQGRAGEIHSAPLDVENSIGRTARYRGEDSAGTARKTCAASLRIRAQVVPIWKDGVIVRRPRQAHVGEGTIRGRKLGIAVGRQIHAGVGRAIQHEREWQRDGSY